MSEETEGSVTPINHLHCLFVKGLLGDYPSGMTPVTGYPKYRVNTSCMPFSLPCYKGRTRSGWGESELDWLGTGRKQRILPNR